MAEIVIRPAGVGDAKVLAANLRESDLNELRAVGYADVLAPIVESVRDSRLCWAAFADGELGCLIGVTPLGDGVGAPWMLGTPVLDRHSRVLVRRTPHYIALMLNEFPRLANYVHVGNVTSVLWLRRLGFTLADPQPYGAHGALFHLFEMHA